MTQKELEAALAPILAAHGNTPVLQAIVSLALARASGSVNWQAEVLHLGEELGRQLARVRQRAGRFPGLPVLHA